MESEIKKDSKDNFELIKNGEIRTRFAPSPTGFLHIGSARTALFNYLFAKKYRGRIVLRIEDTDTERSKREFELDIIENLKWLGIDWDEGPVFAETSTGKSESEYVGNYGPYRQSERVDIYKKYLKKLLENNKAYYCFCSEEELEAKRQEQMSRGLLPRYNGKCAKLPPKEVKKRLDEKQPAVIRLKVPEKKVSFVDVIRGKVEFDGKLFGDIIIAKNLNTPLYNFAAVVDDFEMKITHIIRGEDHLSNTPKQIFLQEALGFNRPIYAHLPLILGPDKSKLSKRHGAMAVAEYKKLGYLPEAIINFLAFLGWNPGTEREIYSLSSLIKDFSIEKIQKSGAIFNVKRLDFLNGFYIRQKSLNKLTNLCLPYLIEKKLIVPVWDQKELIVGIIKSPTEVTGYQVIETKQKISFETLEKIISVYQERLKKLSEIVELTDFFFKDKLSYEKNLLQWKDATDEEIKISLNNLLEILSEIKEDEWDKENLEKTLIPISAGDRGKLLWPFRVALSGKKSSAGPFEIAEILGKNKTLNRIKEARELL